MKILFSGCKSDQIFFKKKCQISIHMFFLYAVFLPSSRVFSNLVSMSLFYIISLLRMKVAKFLKCLAIWVVCIEIMAFYISLICVCRISFTTTDILYSSSSPFHTILFNFLRIYYLILHAF